MGQQQLLLLVLGIVIVGLAVVAGINAFDENQAKSSQDALTNEGFRLASAAKAWYGKPTQYEGGGNTATNLTSGNLGWDELGVEGGSVNTDDEYTTPWGTIALSVTGNTAEFALDVGDDGNSFGTVTFNPAPGSGNDEISFSSGS